MLYNKLMTIILHSTQQLQDGMYTRALLKLHFATFLRMFVQSNCLSTSLLHMPFTFHGMHHPQGVH